MTEQTAGRTLIQDFIAFQQAVGPIYKDAQNPHFRSSYAKLEDVISATYEALNNNGFAVIQPIIYEYDVNGNVYQVLQTELRHISGESVISKYLLTPKDESNPQQMGSAITYARRYALLAMLGLAPEDDDGNAAVGSASPSTSSSSKKSSTDTKPVASSTKTASDPQKDWILKLLAQKLSIVVPDEQVDWIEDKLDTPIDAMTSAQASSIIEE